MPSKQKQLGGLTWVYVTGAGFAISLAAAILLMALVGRTSLPDGLYYLILIPLGLACAAFLFGAMRGYAKYSGQVFAGNLELRGPVVLFLLVILLGMYANRATDFSLTVRVHGPGGPTDVIRDGDADGLPRECATHLANRWRWRGDLQWRAGARLSARRSVSFLRSVAMNSRQAIR